jgi:hypothetical protein
MEYLDGEGSATDRRGIEAHLVTCAACQALADRQRGLSADLAAWRPDPAPQTLRPPQAPAIARPRAWRPSRLVLAGLSTAAAVLIVALYQLPRAAHYSQAQVVAARKVGEAVMLEGRAAKERGIVSGTSPGVVDQGQTTTASHGPAVIRTAALQLVASDFAHARGAVEVILDSVGGFADQLGVSADPGSARVLRGTLRVPGTRLTEVLTRLRALGQVTHDQQNAQDVADQLVDLDARLRSARATEQRLIDLLKQRTGKLSDVLEVEQQLTRVRLDIERLDAEKTNMSRRVAYATIDLTISEERKAGLDPGPLPLWTQIRVAAADGLQSAVDTIVGAALFALRAGPTLTLWLLLLATAWVVVKRVRTQRNSA